MQPTLFAALSPSGAVHTPASLSFVLFGLQNTPLEAFIKLMLLVLAGLIVLGTALYLLVLWYNQRHARQRALQSEFLKESPDNLPPAIAAFLVDEQLEVRHVMATLFDLARRRVISMERHGEQIGLRYINRHSRPLDLFEHNLLSALFAGTTERVVSLHGGLNPVFRQLRKDQEKVAVMSGYWRESLASLQHSSLMWGAGAIAVELVVGAIVMILWPQYLTMMLIVLLAAFLSTIAIVLISPGLRYRLPKGTAVRGQIEAFQRYLRNLKRYTNLQEAKTQFNRLLPYAVAFGIEKEWMKNYRAMTGSLQGGIGDGLFDPFLIDMVSLPRVHVGQLEHAASGLGNAGGEAVSGASDLAGSLPSLDGISDGIMTQLNNASNSFFTMLSDASKLFEGGEAGADAASSAADAASSAAESAGDFGEAASEGADAAGSFFESVADNADWDIFEIFNIFGD
jgi:hypothetical protein